MERSFRSLLVRISTPLNHKELRNALWLKIAEKISFYLTSELRLQFEQKFIKNAKMVNVQIDFVVKQYY